MRLLLIICFLALRALAADNPAADRKRHPGVEEEFTNSKCVFVGKVLSSRQVMDKDGFIQGTFYVVQVEKLLKGNPVEDVEIYDENSSGRFPLGVGGKYLLFAYEGTFEAIQGLRLAINNSGNSGTLSQTRNELKMVRELKKAQHSGAANRSQPVGSETNRTPRAAGSGG